MSVSVPSGGLAVMQNRRTGPDSLDLFPTPCRASLTRPDDVARFAA